MALTRIETPRLALRELEPDSAVDRAFMLALLNDPGWRRGIGESGVSDVEAAGAYIERACAASYREHGFGLYGVERRADGQLVGIAGLVRRAELEAPDLGFAFLEAASGQGFATEAGRAALEDAAERLGLRRVLAISSEDNLASRAVLAKLGFSLVERRQLSPGAAPLALFSLVLAG